MTHVDRLRASQNKANSRPPLFLPFHLSLFFPSPTFFFALHSFTFSAFSVPLPSPYFFFLPSLSFLNTSLFFTYFPTFLLSLSLPVLFPSSTFFFYPLLCFPCLLSFLTPSSFFFSYILSRALLSLVSFLTLSSPFPPLISFPHLFPFSLPLSSSILTSLPFPHSPSFLRLLFTSLHSLFVNVIPFLSSFASLLYSSSFVLPPLIHTPLSLVPFFLSSYLFMFLLPIL